MNRKPLSEMQRQSVARLQQQLDRLRERIGISERGCVLYKADLSFADNGIVVVEADGFGGGILQVVEGNYPLDYLAHNRQAFATESEAVVAAELLREGATV